MTVASQTSQPVIMLGPQGHQQTVAAAVERFNIEGQLATVTAGWEDREGEDSALSQHLGGRTHNLGLFPRAEDVFEHDEGVRALMFEQHDRRVELQALYRMRLASQLKVCRDLLSRTDPAEPDGLIGPELEAGIAGVRALDTHHMQRIASLDEEIADRLGSGNHPTLDAHRQQLSEILGSVGGLLIAGGHVGTMLNRLRLFQVTDFASRLPIVAWSAGAMLLGQRIVLFHDNPPQGPGDAEVHAPGLGIVEGVIPLPHANERLDLHDPARVSLFARRFSPDIGLVLESGASFDTSSGSDARLGDRTLSVLTASGNVLDLAA